MQQAAAAAAESHIWMFHTCVVGKSVFIRASRQQKNVCLQLNQHFPFNSEIQNCNYLCDEYARREINWINKHLNRHARCLRIYSVITFEVSQYLRIRIDFNYEFWIHTYSNANCNLCLILRKTIDEWHGIPMKSIQYQIKIIWLEYSTMMCLWRWFSKANDVHLFVHQFVHDCHYCSTLMHIRTAEYG